MLWIITANCRACWASSDHSQTLGVCTYHTATLTVPLGKKGEKLPPRRQAPISPAALPSLGAGGLPIVRVLTTWTSFGCLVICWLDPGGRVCPGLFLLGGICGPRLSGKGRKQILDRISYLTVCRIPNVPGSPVLCHRQRVRTLPRPMALASVRLGPSQPVPSGPGPSLQTQPPLRCPFRGGNTLPIGRPLRCPLEGVV